VTAAEARPARRARGSSAARGTALIDAACAEIVVVGLDRLSMVGVARRAEVTTGALYPRFESATELAVRVWEERAWPALEQHLDGALIEAREGPMTATAARLVDTPPELVIAAEFLVVAARDAALHEVVAPRIGDWLARHGGTVGFYDGPSIALVGLATLVTGPLAIALTGEVPRKDWAGGLEGFAGALFSDLLPRARGRVEPVMLVVEPARTGDELRDVLLAAAVDVVVESGFENATVARLARRSAYSTQAIYLRYPTKAALFVDVVETVLFPIMRLIGEANLAAFSSADPGAGLGAVAAGYLAPDWARWRRLRLETQLAARHEPELARVFRTEHERSAVDWSAEVTVQHGGRLALLEVLPWVARGGSLGTFLLHPYLPRLDELDWQAAFSAAVAGFAQAAARA